jgi:hypothetical protein
MRGATLGGKGDGIVLGDDDTFTNGNRGRISSNSRTNEDVRITR